MQQRMTRVNASEETIKIGPLGIRYNTPWRYVKF
jgi:hypothetical protein